MTDCIVSRIRFHKHGSGSWLLCMLCVLLVWWVGDHGSAVGWSFRFCFCVPILFRFTSKKFVYLIKKHKRRYVWALCIQIKFFEISNLVWRHAYCSACLLPLPRFLFQPTPAPPHCLCRGGGGLLFKFNPLCVMIVNTGCNEFSLSLVKM